MFSFVLSEKNYISEEKSFGEQNMVTGVVCQTPVKSDYAFSYIIKVDNKNYKIRFSAQEDKFLQEGDCVAISLNGYDDAESTELMEYSLSSKIYFTVFESDECSIKRTGATNLFYENIGIVKREFLKIVDAYLPGENGAIAKAMTIGDETEIDDETLSHFNYCGTSHLLVISGLHLTLWSVSIMKYLYKFSKIRKYAPIIGIICLFLYSSLTGFSVSVLRAGTMVGTVLVAQLFRRGADSINSIGTALIIILLENPFAPYSETLWLTIFSTLGILVFSGKIRFWLKNKTGVETVTRYYIFEFIISSVSISLSVAIFTLPIFVFCYGIIPMMSVLSNLLMVDVAMALMVFTVLGALSHAVFLHPIANACYFVVGIIGKYLRFVAEKIGMWEWATISLDHELYESFAVLLVVCVLVTILLKKYKKDIIKPMTVVLSVIFILMTVYCTNYEYNTPKVDVLITKSNPVIILNSKDESLIIGTSKKKYVRELRDIMERHNQRTIDTIAVNSSDSTVVAELIFMQEKLNIDKVLIEASQVSVNDEMSVDLENDENYIVITCKNKSLLIVDCEKMENLFQKGDLYDIILLYGGKSSDYEKHAKSLLKDDFGKVIVSKENEMFQIYFED